MTSSARGPGDGWDPERIYSVSSLTGRLQELWESHVPMLWLGGEVSNFRRQSSGHLYFTLQDGQSQIACVLFRGDALHLSFSPENGQSILCYGRPEIYAPRGQYQWITRHVLPCGSGRRELEFQKLREQCRREGLFDADRKRPIPLAARHIALLSSPTGAVLQDFLQILRRRDWRGEITLFPCRVQGEGSVQDFLHGLDRAQRSTADLIVLARGGGSAEDLSTFNAEALVRKIAACSKPVISAIGHETDFTLVDFVADLRAETPSSAAGILATRYQTALDRWRYCEQQLTKNAQQHCLRQRQVWQCLQQRLQHASPERQIERWRHHLWELDRKILEDALSFLGVQRQKLSTLQQRQETYNIGRHLREGFLIAENARGKILRRRHEAPPGSAFTLRFHDGVLKVLSLEYLDDPSGCGNAASGPQRWSR